MDSIHGKDATYAGCHKPREDPDTCPLGTPTYLQLIWYSDGIAQPVMCLVLFQWKVSWDQQPRWDDCTTDTFRFSTTPSNENWIHLDLLE